MGRDAAYVAPEQLRGLPVDARADVYALGGVLYHCLTGRLPYPGRRGPDAVGAHLSEPPPRPSADVPELPRGFDAVVARAMAKDPGERYRSAGEVGRAVSPSPRAAACARVRPRSASGRPHRTTGPRRWPSPRRTGGGGGGSRRPSRCLPRRPRSP